VSIYKVLAFSGTDPALAPYRNFVLSRFKKSLRLGNDWFMLIDSQAYFSAYDHVIHNILSRPMTVVRLAVLTDDEDVCLGFSVMEDETLHYVYVKNDWQSTFRKKGIGAALVPTPFSRITHLTTIGQSIRAKKFPDIPFNPFS